MKALDLKKQNMIVKQRLQYHFASPSTGKWNIPESMPFMNEFLNEIESLTDVCDGITDVSTESKLNLAGVGGMLPEEKRRIDLAYLTGVFNVVGIDGLSKEIKRLKEIGKNPHDIFS
jgi:hypothetical protein